MLGVSNSFWRICCQSVVIVLIFLPSVGDTEVESMQGKTQEPRPNPPVNTVINGISTQGPPDSVAVGHNKLPSFAEIIADPHSSQDRVESQATQPSSGDREKLQKFAEEDLGHQELSSHGVSRINTQYPSMYSQQQQLTPALICAYHDPIFHGSCHGAAPDLRPLERYLAERSSEQHAIFIRPDNGELSIKKGCQCLEIIQLVVDGVEGAEVQAA
jgi:hypothetical protein